MKLKNKFLLASAAAGALIFLNEKRSQLNQRNIAGAVVAITGGSRGLGIAMARELAAEGCRLAICARDEDELTAACVDLEKRGAKVFTFVCDVSNREEINSFEKATTTHFGRIDIWINNAAVIKVGPIETMDIEDFEKAMDINFWGQVYGAMAVLPQMLERGSGHIVNINSSGGMISLPHLSTYSAAKSAGHSFSESLSMELSSKGIQVTTVSPGPLRTGSYAAAEYSGASDKELKWFGGQASFPIPAPIGPLSAENAALLIVRAIKRGVKRVVIPPIPFEIVMRLDGLFPEVSLAVRTWINNRLPEPIESDKNQSSAQGKEVLEEMDGSLLKSQMQEGRVQGSTLNQQS